MTSQALPLIDLDSGAPCRVSVLARSGHIAESASARHVITDYHAAQAAVVSMDRQIDEVHSEMRHLGLRALLVTDSDACLVGLITTQDILGERPTAFINSAACPRAICKRSDVRVGDVMTSLDDLKMIDTTDVDRATVGDIAATFRERDFSHLLICDRSDPGHCSVIRGVVSRLDVERALGGPIANSRVVAANFAEIESALAHEPRTELNY